MFCSFLIGGEAKLQFNFLGYFLGLILFVQSSRFPPDRDYSVLVFSQLRAVPALLCMTLAQFA
jgi:hypothetical protein